jgi:hypothetical protein
MYCIVFCITCLLLVVYGCSERSSRLAFETDDLPISAPHYTDTRRETIQPENFESDSRKSIAVASDHGSQRHHAANTPTQSVSNMQTGTISYPSGVPVCLNDVLACVISTASQSKRCTAPDSMLSNNALRSVVQERSLMHGCSFFPHSFIYEFKSVFGLGAHSRRSEGAPVAHVSSPLN